MTKTYTDALAEIAKLQLEAERLRKLEVTGVIARIRKAIEVYGLTPDDLWDSKTARTATTVKATTADAAVKQDTKIGVPKYRDPKSGKTWTGRGKPPTWINGTKDRETFAIAAGSAGGASQDVKPKATNAIAAVGQPKYRDPKTGKTWTGRGKPPLWIASKKNREAFAIDAEPVAAETPPAPVKNTKVIMKKRKVSSGRKTPLAAPAESIAAPSLPEAASEALAL